MKKIAQNDFQITAFESNPGDLRDVIPTTSNASVVTANNHISFLFLLNKYQLLWPDYSLIYIKWNGTGLP